MKKYAIVGCVLALTIILVSQIAQLTFFPSNFASTTLHLIFVSEALILQEVIYRYGRKQHGLKLTMKDSKQQEEKNKWVSKHSAQACLLVH